MNARSVGSGFVPFSLRSVLSFPSLKTLGSRMNIRSVGSGFVSFFASLAMRLSYKYNYSSVFLQI